MPHSYTIEEANNKKPKLSRLIILSFSEKRVIRARFVNVKCECGNKKVISLNEFISGGTLSCGCLSRDIIIKRNTKYTLNHKELCACWHDMMRRCYNKTCKNYKWYGSVGVSVCEEWHNYQNFLNWAITNGWEKGYHLDKDIKGNGKLYSPNTCIFVKPLTNLKAKGVIIRNSDGTFAGNLKLFNK